MSENPERTFESDVLDRFPQVREEVKKSDAFQKWQHELPKVDVDGVQYFIRGGDMLKDEEQIVFEWARKNGLLTDDLLEGETGQVADSAD